MRPFLVSTVTIYLLLGLLGGILLYRVSHWLMPPCKEAIVIASLSFHKAAGFKNTGNKLAFILSIKNLERPVYNLGFVHEQYKGILAYVRFFDLIPFDGHTFARIYFHENLLAADLILKSLK